MTNKAHLALLGIGGVAVLIYLMRKSSAQPAAPEAVASAASPTLAGPTNDYPNVGPTVVPMLKGAAPYYMGYNSAPPLDLPSILQGIADAGEPTPTPQPDTTSSPAGCGCNNGCPGNGNIVAQQKVAPVAARTAAGALRSFVSYASAAPAAPAISSPFVYSSTGVLIGLN